MNIAIIDDDRMAINALIKELETYSDVIVTGNVTTGKRGLELVVEQKPDILFLDIELPDMSGINFIEQLKEIPHCNFKIVIYSSYDKYMLESFRMSVFDFLLKPIDRNNLNTIIQRYKNTIASDKDAATLLIPESSNQKYNKFLLYTNSLDFVLAKPNNIGLFHYNHHRKIWEVSIAGKPSDIALKHSVTSEMILNLSNDFVQVHQSYIININYLIEVVDNVCHFYPPFDHVNYVTVGRIFRKKLIERFYSI
jgi:two-component system, LytTR family, response regulator